jgi:glutamyl-tRNA reductase
LFDGENISFDTSLVKNINSTNIPPITIINRIYEHREKILSTPSFGGEVKLSFPCHRFAACKRSLNGVEVVISAKLPDSILAHSSYFRRWDLSRHGGR